MEVVIKRAYDAPSAGDGYRVLVDRLWPRGIKKEALALDEWCKDVAPSNELRKWFGHEPARFAEFKARYLKELAGSEVPRQLLDHAGDQNLTLVYSAKNPAYNQAVVLRQYLQQIA